MQAAFTLVGLVQPGYSAFDEAISYLEVGQFGWIQQINFLVFGLALLAFAFAYTQRIR